MEWCSVFDPLLGHDAGAAQIPAARDRRITFLDEDEVSRPGPRLAAGLEAMAAALELTAK